MYYIKASYCRTGYLDWDINENIGREFQIFALKEGGSFNMNFKHSKEKGNYFNVKKMCIIQQN